MLCEYLIIRHIPLITQNTDYTKHCPDKPSSPGLRWYITEDTTHNSATIYDSRWTCHGCGQHHKATPLSSLPWPWVLPHCPCEHYACCGQMYHRGTAVSIPSCYYHFSTAVSNTQSISPWQVNMHKKEDCIKKQKQKTNLLQTGQLSKNEQKVIEKGLENLEKSIQWSKKMQGESIIAALTNDTHKMHKSNRHR